jgi:hypothetical protein
LAVEQVVIEACVAFTGDMAVVVDKYSIQL